MLAKFLDAMSLKVFNEAVWVPDPRTCGIHSAGKNSNVVKKKNAPYAKNRGPLSGHWELLNARQIPRDPPVAR